MCCRNLCRIKVRQILQCFAHNSCWSQIYFLIAVQYGIKKTTVGKGGRNLRQCRLQVQGFLAQLLVCFYDMSEVGRCGFDTTCIVICECLRFTGAIHHAFFTRPRSYSSLYFLF